MPRLSDSLALTLALTSCSPYAVKSVPYTSAAPDGYDCKQLQNGVKSEIERCCLTINPYMSCVETGRAVDALQARAGGPDSYRSAGPVTAIVGGHKFPSYALFKKEIPPADYLKYLANTAQSAADLAGALTAFVAYQQIADGSLLAPEEIISRGAGDCDNMSNLFVEMLGMTGKKSGYNYRAKVVGMEEANHAVAVFLDTDGKWKSFDFKSRLIDIAHLPDGGADLYSASNIFENGKGDSGHFYVRKRLAPSAGKGSSADEYIDPETMNPNGKEIALTVNINYDPAIEPDFFIRDYNWRSTGMTHIHYLNNIAAYYRNGVFLQIDTPDRLTVFDKDHNVIENYYKNDPIITADFFTPSGFLKKRLYKDGRVERFDQI